MWKKVFVIFLTSLIIFTILYITSSLAEIPDKIDRLPQIDLPIPKVQEERDYLGLSNQGTFRIPQIKASLVFIEIFSMYCPHCQKDAPRINELYQLIENDQDLKKNIKMIGIGVGNTPFEVEYYKKTFQVPFPLFHDKDYKIHRALGEVRTPFFILVRIYEDKSHRVIYRQLGQFPGAKAFLEMMLKLYTMGKEEKL